MEIQVSIYYIVYCLNHRGIIWSKKFGNRQKTIENFIEGITRSSRRGDEEHLKSQEFLMKRTSTIFHKTLFLYTSHHTVDESMLLGDESGALEEVTGLEIAALSFYGRGIQPIQIQSSSSTSW